MHGKAMRCIALMLLVGMGTGAAVAQQETKVEPGGVAATEVQAAAEEKARQEADARIAKHKAKEEARAEAERQKAEQQAKAEAEKQAAAEAKAEAARLKAEQKAQAEAEKQAAAEAKRAAQAEAMRVKAEQKAQSEAEKQAAAEEKARQEAEARIAKHKAKEEARAEAERLKAEQAKARAEKQAAQIPANSPEVLVEQWVKDWAGKDVDGYLSRYDIGFRPAGGKDRKSWEAKRRSQIGAASSIKVRAENLKIEPQGELMATANFMEIVEVGDYKKTSHKKLLLVRGDRDGEWKIREEKEATKREVKAEAARVKSEQEAEEKARQEAEAGAARLKTEQEVQAVAARANAEKKAKAEEQVVAVAMQSAEVETVRMKAEQTPQAVAQATAETKAENKPGNKPEKQKADRSDMLVGFAQKALLKSPDELSRWHNFQAADNDTPAAQGGDFPRFDITLDSGREHGQSQINNYGVNTKNITFTLTQMLYDGFATRNEVRRLSNAQLARYYELLDASETAALEAVRVFYDVSRQRRLFELTEDNYVRHRTAYEQIKLKVAAGVGRRVDLEQAAGRLALSESNLTVDNANVHDVSARFQRV
ncbi:MAG: TolC family protein, partial [Burkholderiales bacterium]|nr:TolC family protein [Burkholderiales bacterium]